MKILRQKEFSYKRGDKEGGGYAGELGLAAGIGGGLYYMLTKTK